MNESRTDNNSPVDEDATPMTAEEETRAEQRLHEFFDELFGGAFAKVEEAILTSHHKHMIIHFNNSTEMTVLMQRWKCSRDQGVELLNITPADTPDSKKLKRLSFPMSNIRCFRVEDC